jgi:DtxR family Mn-dependent transcriptional regulator
VAASLDVTPASVAEMFKRLHDEGLVVHKKYEGVKLTRKGNEVARAVQRRHTIIRTFLEIIGVPPEVADNDACVMEHHLHPVTIEKLSTFVKFVETAPEPPFWLDHYSVYEKTGHHQCENKKQ